MEERLVTLEEAVRKENAETTDTTTRLESSFGAKLSSFKRDLQSDHSEVAEMAAKKAKLDKSYEFQSKGNENQYVFNDTVSQYNSGSPCTDKKDGVDSERRVIYFSGDTSEAKRGIDEVEEFVGRRYENDCQKAEIYKAGRQI